MMFRDLNNLGDSKDQVEGLVDMLVPLLKGFIQRYRRQCIYDVEESYINFNGNHGNILSRNRDVTSRPLGTSTTGSRIVWQHIS